MSCQATISTLSRRIVPGHLSASVWNNSLQLSLWKLKSTILCHITNYTEYILYVLARKACSSLCTHYHDWWSQVFDWRWTCCNNQLLKLQRLPMAAVFMFPKWDGRRYCVVRSCKTESKKIASVALGMIGRLRPPRFLIEYRKRRLLRACTRSTISLAKKINTAYKNMQRKEILKRK